MSRMILLVTVVCLGAGAVMFAEEEVGVGTQRKALKDMLQDAAKASSERAGDDDGRFARYYVRSVLEKLVGEKKEYGQYIVTPMMMEAAVSDKGFSFFVDDDSPIWTDRRFLANARELYGPDGPKDPYDFSVLGEEDGEDVFADCVQIAGDERRFCSGVLVGRNVVLTAGHCSPELPTRVLIGPDARNPKQEVRIRLVARHRDYSREWKEDRPRNDLMVLILETRPVGVVPKRIAIGKEIDAAKHGLVVGYGSNRPEGSGGEGVRRYAAIPIASPGCAGPKDPAAYHCTPEQELVAVDVFEAGRDPRDSCNGDSGGPFYIQVGGAWCLAATVSRTAWVGGRPPRRPCGPGGIYVRVDAFWEWVRSVPGVEL